MTWEMKTVATILSLVGIISVAAETLCSVDFSAAERGSVARRRKAPDLKPLRPNPTKRILGGFARDAGK